MFNMNVIAHLTCVHKLFIIWVQINQYAWTQYIRPSATTVCIS